MQKIKSFTLIELLVTMAIIGILTATVSVSLTQITPQRLKEESPKLLNDLRWARELAVAKSIGYTVDFDVDGDNSTDEGEYIIYQTDNTSKIVSKRKLNLCPTNPVSVQLRTLKQPLALESPDSYTNLTEVNFTALTGRVEDQDADVTTTETIWIELTFQAVSRRITIFSDTGYIMLED